MSSTGRAPDAEVPTTAVDGLEITQVASTTDAANDQATSDGAEGEEKPKSKSQILRAKRKAAKLAAATRAAEEAASKQTTEAAPRLEIDVEQPQKESNEKAKATVGAKSQDDAKEAANKTKPKAEVSTPAKKKNARSKPESDNEEPASKKQRQDVKEDKDEKAEKISKVFIGGLPLNTSAEDLQECFSAVGPIKKLDLKSTFAFIEFESPATAQLAVSRYHEGWFMDHQIRVELSTAAHKSSLQPNARSGPSTPAQGQACFKCGKPGHRIKDCRSKIDIRGPNTPAHQFQFLPNQMAPPFYPAAAYAPPMHASAYGPPAGYNGYAPPYGYNAYAPPPQWYGPPQGPQGYQQQPYPQQGYQQQGYVQSAGPMPSNQRPPQKYAAPRSGRAPPAQQPGYDCPPHQGPRSFQPQAQAPKPHGQRR